MCGSILVPGTCWTEMQDIVECVDCAPRWTGIVLHAPGLVSIEWLCLPLLKGGKVFRRTARMAAQLSRHRCASVLHFRWMIHFNQQDGSLLARATPTAPSGNMGVSQPARPPPPEVVAAVYYVLCRQQHAVHFSVVASNCCLLLSGC